MKKPIPALLALLLLLTGCRPPAPVQATPTPEPTPAPTPLSPVYTDWSKLTPYEPTPPLYTLHPGYHAGGLEARDDYGTLLPYIGKYSGMDRYVIDKLPLWGLVNDRGELVCGPVYARVSCFDGFLLLRRGDPAHYDPENSYSDGRFSLTLAAPDGSWAHDFKGTCLGAGHGIALTADLERNLTVWNRDGEVVTRFAASLFTPRLGEDFFWFWGGEGGVNVDWLDDKVGYLTSYRVDGEYRDDPVRLYLDFTTGAVLDAPPPGYSVEIDYEALDERPTPPEIEGFSYLDPITDRVTGITYYYGYYRGGQYADDPVDALFDGEGNLLLTGCSLLAFEQNIIVHSGLCSTLEDDCFCYRSLRDGSLVFRCPMGTNSD